MDEQTRIGGDSVADPIPDGQQCEWRHPLGDEPDPVPATVAIPIKRKMKGGKNNATVDTGMRKYACERHRKVAEEQCATPLPSLRKR